MKRTFATLLVLVFAATSSMGADEEGFKTIFDGKSFKGWKMATENTDTWKIEEGAIVARGSRCHLFYVGDEAPFTNFELKIDVMTEPNSNGGIYFHTAYQPTGWPRAGFECQVNVSHGDWKKTGSLYDVVNLASTPAKDNKWWTQHIVVKDNQVTVRIDGQIVIHYTEPEGARSGSAFGRKISKGTFGLQAHDPKSVVRYKNLRVKRLD